MGDAPAKTAAERRAERRRAMPFGKAKSFAEHEAQGLAYWSEVDPAVKLDAIVELIEAVWYLQGGDGPPPGLDRSTHGARKLRS